jgi:hypothetical protein
MKLYFINRDLSTSLYPGRHFFSAGVTATPSAEPNERDERRLEHKRSFGRKAGMFHTFRAC